MIVRAYFVLGGAPGSAGLVPVLRVVPKSAAVATAAMNALLAGPTTKEAGDRTMTSAIPDGTGLLGVTIKNGVATANLSTAIRFGRRGAVAAVPPGTGRLHADPVHDRQVGRVPDRRPDGDGLRQRRHRPRRSGRPRRLHGPAAGDLRRPAGLRCRDRQPGQASAAMPTCSRRRSGPRSSTGRARRSSTSRSWRRAGPAAEGRSRRRCRTPSARPSTGRSGCTTRPRRTAPPESIRDYPVWLTPAG